MPRKENNIELLVVASDCLEPLLDKLVFVGGATTGLFITDPATPDIRETKDVDVIVEVQHHGEYRRLEQSLTELGFQPDQDKDAPICRFRHRDVLLDVMPTDESVLGFSNPWYRPAVATAEYTVLSNGKSIRQVTAPYFIATKLAAFEGRGNQDFLSSHDFEDIIAVINGRPELVDELNGSDDKLHRYVAARFKDYLEQPNLIHALPGILIEGDARTPIVIDRLRKMSQ